MTNTTSATDRQNGETIEKKVAPHSFQSFRSPRPLSDGVLRYVREQGFTRMTPVQAATIPQFLSHKDVAVQAQTGSGKTLAFLIPIVEILVQKKQKHPHQQHNRQEIGALVLSPTRELALQTYQVAMDLLACFPGMADPLLLVGGGSASSSSGTNQRPVTADLKAFQEKGSDILIGTPGRVNDILSRYAVIDCSELECLVLDEADVLLNMGFSTTLEEILRHLPKMRRTALFSATQSGSTTSTLTDWMKRMSMRNPVWIDVSVASKPTLNNEDTSKPSGTTKKQQATPSTLTNYFVVTRLEEKVSRLAAMLQQHANEKMIVFFLTCATVDFYGTAFQKLFPELSVELLHGKMVQKRREKTMERFRNVDGVALFCTDVAARGIDVSSVEWVVQMDAPQDPAYFVHRVGRSARAGKRGKSLIFLTPKEEAYVDLLRMRNVPLEPLPSTEQCAPPQTSEDDNENNIQQNSGNYPSSTTDAKTNRLRSAADPNLVLDDVLPKIRDLVLKDRDLLEKGTKAFTSYIRAYKEHHCAFIFRFASLDLGVLATSFCLLRLPKMPELRDVLNKHKGKLPHFTSAGQEVDIVAIPFIDKAREQARQRRLKEHLEAGGKSIKLIEAERRKEEKDQKEKDRRQKAKEKGRNPDKKRGKQAQIVDEWDDLAKEERLVKKLRRGKITKVDFNKQMSDV